MKSSQLRGAEVSVNRNQSVAGSSVDNRPDIQPQQDSESAMSSISAYTSTQSSIVAPAFSQFTQPDVPDIANTDDSEMETNSESGLRVESKKLFSFSIEFAGTIRITK